MCIKTKGKNLKEEKEKELVIFFILYGGIFIEVAQAFGFFLKRSGELVLLEIIKKRNPENRSQKKIKNKKREQEWERKEEVKTPIDTFNDQSTLAYVMRRDVIR